MPDGLWAYKLAGMPYWERLSETAFRATHLTSGAWNIQEQHIAPAMGLLAHLVERDRDHRRPDVSLLPARLSYDILGTLPVDTCETEVRVLRPERTVELVEATLSHDGRAALVLRAWLLATRDTTALAGHSLAPIPRPQDLTPWVPGEDWPGDFIGSVEIRRDLAEPGRGCFWARTNTPLLGGEPVSALARLAGLFDIANGMTVRLDPREVLFPNLDLCARFTREPAGEWFGFDNSVMVDRDGVGMTTCILHDAHGPLGALGQTTTVRPR